MIQLLKSGLIAVVLMVGLTGCATGVPIHNVKDAPVKTLSGKELTLDQATKAIVLAGMGLNWEMEVATPGHIVGTLNLRSHQAVVDIPYNTRVYSILYKSSKNLLIPIPSSIPSNTGTRGIDDRRNSVQQKKEGIHPNYNSWIENLNNAIRTQFIAVER
jgi:hypothetical protein